MARREDNLKPIKKGELSKEEAMKRGSAGGKKSGEVRAEKRLLKDTIEMLLKSKPTPEIVDQYAERFGFNPKDLQEVITGGLIQKAMCGDAKAFEVLRDTAGQKPIDKKEITGADGEPLTVKKVYITPEQQAEVEKHIKGVIEGQ